MSEYTHEVCTDDLTVYAIDEKGERFDLNADGETIEATDELRAFIVELGAQGAYDDETMRQLLRDTITDEDASRYVVVNDGQFVSAVKRSGLSADDSEEALSAGDSDDYQAFCDRVGYDNQFGTVGSAGCIAWCYALMDAGADCWDLR